MPKADPAVAQAIKEAADRLLAGRPIKATAGRLSASELAIEAGVSRARLYDTYEDLKNAFEDQVKEQKADPPPATLREQELSDANEGLKQEVAALRDRLSVADGYRERWQEAAHAAFRIVNVLEVEKAAYVDTIEGMERRVERLEREKKSLKAEKEDLAERLRSRPTRLHRPQGD
jgi:chromosome segregation ATPase